MEVVQMNHEELAPRRAKSSMLDKLYEEICVVLSADNITDKTAIRFQMIEVPKTKRGIGTSYAYNKNGELIREATLRKLVEQIKSKKTSLNGYVLISFVTRSILSEDKKTKTLIFGRFEFVHKTTK